MKSVYPSILICIVAWAICPLLQAQEVESGPGVMTEQELLEEAARLYNLDKFDQAAALYERVLRSGRHSAGLYFNLGNTHYKSNRLGPSIFYFEKALLLAPGDREIQDNLRYAQQQRIDDIEVLPLSLGRQLSMSFLGWFHYDTWAAIAVGFSFLLSALFIVYFVSINSKQKRLFFVLGSIAGFLFIGSLLSAWAAYTTYQREQPAIIFERQTTLNEAPNDRAEVLFDLHEGTKVYVLDQLDEWARVRLENGLTGWMPASAIRKLKDGSIPEWSPAR